MQIFSIFPYGHIYQLSQCCILCFLFFFPPSIKSPQRTLTSHSLLLNLQSPTNFKYYSSFYHYNSKSRNTRKGTQSTQGMQTTQTMARSKLNMNDFLAGLNSNSPPQLDSHDVSSMIDFAGTDFINFDNIIPVDPALKESIDPEQSWNISNSDLLSNDFQFNQLSHQDISPLIPDSSSFQGLLDSNYTQNSNGSASAKRKLDLLDPNLNPSERVRVEAEEDKRRRNTAASARFRVKKKMREQLLEKNAKEMSDKVSKLEKRVNDLELENKWLKGLITDKTEASEFSALLDKFITENGLEDKTQSS